MAYADSNFEKVRGIYNQIEAWNFEEFKVNCTTV